MKAGRELDAMVAEKVMGATRGPSGRYTIPLMNRWGILPDKLPRFSTDITAAWMVVEKMAPKDDEFRLTNFKGQRWECTFRFFEGDRESAETAPMAICLAALAALQSLGSKEDGK